MFCWRKYYYRKQNNPFDKKNADLEEGVFFPCMNKQISIRAQGRVKHCSSNVAYWRKQRKLGLKVFNINLT